MIDYIRGEITELTPAGVVLENNGIGYYLNISLTTYSALAEKREAKLYVYEAIREDAHQLFGFLDKQERTIFLLLISVSGVGANTARVILSSLSVPELTQAIQQENIVPLKSVKGIGVKTAQRIIIDLRDKVASAGAPPAQIAAETSAKNEVMEEAIAALTMLGFPAAASQKVVQKLLKQQPTLRVEEIIKQGLKLL